jgi:hypothetical protein
MKKASGFPLLRAILTVLGIVVLIPIAIALPGHRSAASEDNPSDPWTAAQTVTPSALAAELKQAHPPAVVYVGVHTLYLGAHVPGATFHGPGSTAKGIAELKSYAEKLPRDSELVLYCGCCPLERCPNIRPAFSALKEMGFTHLRVLILPTSFAADWVEKGYPVEKGQ